MRARALLASPFGFLIGFSLGALGGGGSILAVPVLVLVAGQTPSRATSTSLVVVGVAAAIGAYGHWRRGRVRVAAGLVFGLVGIVGSIAGTALNRRLDGDLLLFAFAGLILVAAWRIMVGCPSCTRSGEARALADEGADEGAGEGADLRLDATARSTVRVRQRTLGAAHVATIAAAGTAVGFLTGLFGVGGGFVIVPALALILRFPMPQAVGTSLLVIVVNTAVALAARVGTGAIDWPTTAVFTAAAIAGVGVGERLGGRMNPESLQRGFAALLVVVAGYTGVTALLRIV